MIVLPETCITGYLSQDLKTNWHIQGPLLGAFRVLVLTRSFRAQVESLLYFLKGRSPWTVSCC